MTRRLSIQVQVSSLVGRASRRETTFCSGRPDRRDNEFMAERCVGEIGIHVSDVSVRECRHAGWSKVVIRMRIGVPRRGAVNAEDGGEEQACATSNIAGTLPQSYSLLDAHHLTDIPANSSQ